MQLEDYFDFLAPDDIRIAGTRVGIENVLLDYLQRNLGAEQIAERYPSVSLEQVYATILYYLHNKEAMSAYVADWLEWGRQQRRLQEENPSPIVQKLRQIKRERQKSGDDHPLSAR